MFNMCGLNFLLTIYEMKKETAKDLINRYRLIPGNIGRKILYAIENNLPISTIDLPKGVSHKQIEDIKVLYKNKAEFLSSGNYPRNIIFYHLIKDKIPNFEWEIECSNGSAKKNVEIKSPRVKNLRPSLLSLLLDKVDPCLDFRLHREYKCVAQLSVSHLKIISDLMEEMEIVYPGERQMKKIIDWIQAGLNGSVLTIFSPVCPDYSVEATGNPDCPYRHTFNELGSSLGLIAKRILNALPLIVKSLNNCGIEVNIIVGVGDFEAFADANLKRLNITQIEFLKRVRKSKIAFEESCKVPTSVYMITDMFGGSKEWYKIYQKFVDRLNEENYGASRLSSKVLLQIVRKRKNLYDRWYGKKQLIDHIPQVIMQGAEYAAMGCMLNKYNNCLILGADNDAMSPFYSVYKEIPTLYLKRFYC